MSISKEETKLLLQGCDCDNCCIFIRNSNEWCQKRGRKPRSNVCISWKKKTRLDLKNILPIIRNVFPNMIAKDLISISPLFDSTKDIFKVIREVTSEQKTDKETPEK